MGAEAIRKTLNRCLGAYNRPLRRLIFAGICVVIAGCAQTGPILSGSGASTSPETQKSAGFGQFPDIPIPSGSKINTDKTLVFGSEPWFGQLALNSGTNADALFDFYRSTLPQYRWEEVTSVRAPTSILTYTNGERVLAIAIRGATLGGSEVTVTVSPRGTNRQSQQPSGGLMPAPVQTIQ